MIDKRDAIALLQAYYKNEYEYRGGDGGEIPIWSKAAQNFLCSVALGRIRTPEIRDMLEELRATDDPYDCQALAQHGLKLRI